MRRDIAWDGCLIPRGENADTEGKAMSAHTSGGRLVEAYRRMYNRLGHTRVFAWLVRNVFTHTDELLYRASRGRLLTAGPVLWPTLLLTTVGRRSGESRTVPLHYIEEGDRYGVATGNVGMDRPAFWARNLEANPEATVQVGDEIIRCRATRVVGEDRDRIWHALAANWPAFDTYAERTPLERYAFWLDPIDPPS